VIKPPARRRGKTRDTSMSEWDMATGGIHDWRHVSRTPAPSPPRSRDCAAAGSPGGRDHRVRGGTDVLAARPVGRQPDPPLGVGEGGTEERHRPANEGAESADVVPDDFVEARIGDHGVVLADHCPAFGRDGFQPFLGQESRVGPPADDLRDGAVGQAPGDFRPVTSLTASPVATTA